MTRLLDEDSASIISLASTAATDPAAALMIRITAQLPTSGRPTRYCELS